MSNLRGKNSPRKPCPVSKDHRPRQQKWLMRMLYWIAALLTQLVGQSFDSWPGLARHAPEIARLKILRRKIIGAAPVPLPLSFHHQLKSTKSC